MTDVIIRAEGLGKRYRIGARKARYRTLRDTLVESVRMPLQRFQSVMKGDSATAGSESLWALKDLSFEVAQGEILGVIGRNGAGKSTLLKILSRITEPTEGYVDLDGRVGSLLEVGTGFHGELTGRENIFLNGAILGMKRKEIERKFDEIVAFAEIPQFIDTPVKHYSSGMYMRLAFAVAAHLEPDILIVDEVLAVGDAAFQKKCLGKMDEVAHQGRTVLFVSHNMPAVLKLCTRAMWLQSGRIAEVGNVDSLIHRYLSEGLAVSAEQHFSDTRAHEQSLTEMFFTGVRILNSDSSPSSLIYRTQGFNIEVLYRVLQPIDGLQIGIALWNQEGACVLTSTNMDENIHLIEHKTEPGEYAARIEIPANLLQAGRYWIDLVSGIPNKRRLDRLEQSIAFEVVDDHSQELRAPQWRVGIVGPILAWNTVKTTELQC